MLLLVRETDFLKLQKKVPKGTVLPSVCYRSSRNPLLQNTFRQDKRSQQLLEQGGNIFTSIFEFRIGRHSQERLLRSLLTALHPKLIRIQADFFQRNRPKTDQLQNGRFG